MTTKGNSNNYFTDLYVYDYSTINMYLEVANSLKYLWNALLEKDYYVHCYSHINLSNIADWNYCITLNVNVNFICQVLVG